MATTTLTVNETGVVLHSSQSPNTLEELLPFKEIIDGLISNAPDTEITVVDYGDVWFSGPVDQVIEKFAEKSREFSATNSVIYGTSRSDNIDDTSNSDTLVSGAGNDMIIISTGDDVVIGGPGTDSVFFLMKNIDTLNFTQTSDPNVVDVTDDQTGEQITLIGVENVLFFEAGYPIEFLLT